MSPRLPGHSGAEVVRALERAGFTAVSTRGSHCKLRGDGRVVIVPLHRDVRAGTLASILKQAGMDAEELKKYLK